MRLHRVTVLYVRRALESWLHCNYNSRLNGRKWTVRCWLQNNSNCLSRMGIRSTPVEQGMNSPIRNEGCGEELAAGGNPGPPLRDREAGKIPCHSACCRTLSQDISRPICLPAWSSFFAILPSRSGTTPGTKKYTVQSGRWILKFRRTTVLPSTWQKFITAFEHQQQQQQQQQQLGLWGVSKVSYLRA